MASLNPEPVIPPEVQAWSDKLSTSVFLFAIVTAIFIGLAALFFSLGNLTEIGKNFAKYRCNPLMMPFAGQFGYDSKENFNFCITNIFNAKAAEIFAPLYGILSQFTSVMTVMMNATLGIRKLFSNLFLSINTYIAGVRNRIQNLLFEIRMSFLKINNLMGRVFGTMFAVIYMGTSALTAANNLAFNDVTIFLSEFCFDPETPVRLADGSYKEIQDLKIGDGLSPLADGVSPFVTSFFEFDGAQTPMVRVDDVVVSKQHYISYKNEWIVAGDHPRAVPVASLSRLICLNVTDNVFKVGISGLLARDYDEHSTPGVGNAAQTIASHALNGIDYEAPPIADYSLGIDGSMMLELSGGKQRAAQTIRVGDTLLYAGRVVGVVREACDAVVYLPSGHKVSAAQLVFVNGVWVRAGVQWPDRVAPAESLYQFVTERCGAISAVVSTKSGISHIFFRDYREVPLPEMESPYEEEFNSPASQTMAPGTWDMPALSIY
jgi:hypothetical protein